MDNRGGIARLVAVPIAAAFSDGSFDPESVNDNRAVVFPVFPGQKYAFSETQSESVQGRLYKVNIIGYFPKYMMSSSDLNRLRSGKFVVVHMNNMGECKMSGSEIVPLNCNITEETGEEKTDMNKISFEFSGTESSPSSDIDNQF